MNSRLQRAIEAFRDGGLTAWKRRRMKRVLEQDESARRYLEQGEALSRVIREAWTEGPACPPAERFLAAIRPELMQIDAQRARAARQRAAATRLRWLRPLPFSLGGLAAAAALLAVPTVRGPVLALLEGGETAPRMIAQAFPPPGAQLQRSLEGQEVALLGDGMVQGIELPGGRPAGADLSDSGFTGAQLVQDERGGPGPHPAIYDLYQGDAALLVYDGQDESPLLIFALPDEGDDLSLAPDASGGWA